MKATLLQLFHSGILPISRKCANLVGINEKFPIKFLYKSCYEYVKFLFIFKFRRKLHVKSKQHYQTTLKLQHFGFGNFSANATSDNFF